MAATTSSFLDNMTGAIALSGAALEVEAGPEVRRAAMRSLRRALDEMADSDEIWTDLTDRATRIPDIPDQGPVNAVLDLVADVFVERYAVLLVAGGYTAPPPPRVDELLAQARQALLSDPVPQPLDRLANTRDGLRGFVQVVSADLNSQNSWQQQRVLRAGRKAVAASLLLSLVWATEITSGDQFHVSFGSSPKDKAAIDITVPGPGARLGAAAGRIAVGGAQHLERTLEAARSTVESGRTAAQFAVDQSARSGKHTDQRAGGRYSSEWRPTWKEDSAGREQRNGRGHGG